MPTKAVRASVLALLLLCGASPGLAAEPQAFVDPPPIHIGEVTASAPGEIVINGNRYLVLPDAVVQTDEAKPRRVPEVKPGEIVQYRLKQGKIDRLIVMTRK